MAEQPQENSKEADNTTSKPLEIPIWIGGGVGVVVVGLFAYLESGRFLGFQVGALGGLVGAIGAILVNAVLAALHKEK